MTATQARQKLGTILGRVLQGEDIGIVHSGTGKIIALRPVEVYSEDYALIDVGSRRLRCHHWNVRWNE